MSRRWNRATHVQPARDTSSTSRSPAPTEHGAGGFSAGRGEARFARGTAARQYDSRVMTALRPSHVCRALLSALDAADGRRRKRKRDQTADAIGLALKRTLLERAVADDPEPAAFEQWLLE